MDKLEVRKMALQAMCSAVNCLDPNAHIELSYFRGQKEVRTSGIRWGNFCSNPSRKHAIGRQLETECPLPLNSEHGSAIKKPVRGQGPDTEELGVPRGTEQVSDEMSGYSDHCSDSNINEEDEVAQDEETEVQSEADVGEPDKGIIEKEIDVEVVGIETDNDMEDPLGPSNPTIEDPDPIATSYPKEHDGSPVHVSHNVFSSSATPSEHYSDCCMVDFYGFEVSGNHKQYLEVIYGIEGAFWKGCAIQSPEWISTLLRLFGDALAMSDRPWSSLSRDDLGRMVLSIEDARAIGFSVHCLDPLIEEARSMIASYDKCLGVIGQLNRVKEEIESVKGKLAFLKNQRRELKGKLNAHSITLGRSSTAFSFVSRVNYVLVGSPKY